MSQLGTALVAYHGALLSRLRMRSWIRTTENENLVNGFKSLRGPIDVWQARESTTEDRAKWLKAGLVLFNGVRDFAAWLGEEENNALAQSFVEAAKDVKTAVAVPARALQSLALIVVVGFVFYVLWRTKK